MSNKQKVKPEVREENREERVGLGMKHRAFSVPEGLVKPGYVLRIINDHPRGRIESAIKSGYEYVLNDTGKNVHLGEGSDDNNSDIGSKISMIVDKSPRMAGEARGYLMQIKKDWYDADQLQKLKKTDVRDQAIKTGKSGATDNDGFYAEVKYET